ncbi:flagellar hook assembly protein FlgD [Geminicoccaceae bacterium 1502E]|nr:flagellar hook assembly protein FlgD [Geminicoccaceae bacterium 1502E]
MTIVAASSAGSSAGGTTKGAVGFGQDFTGFLQILTTQLRTQDPTAPMDADKFTSQLVQFAGVEQALRTNAQLERLVALSEASQATASLQYLGAEVSVDGSVVSLDRDRGAMLRYRLEDGAAQVRVQILDGSGALVRELPGNLGAGEHRLTWDGIRSDGTAAAPGVYRAVVRATGASGEEIPASLEWRGRVSAIETGKQGVALVVDGLAVPFAAVRTIGAPSS